MLKKVKYRLKVIKTLLPFTKGVKRLFFFIFLLSIVITGLSFVTPLFYKIFVDEVIIGRDFKKMLFVAVGYVGIFLAGVLIGYIKKMAEYKLVNTVLLRSKQKIWKNYLTRPFADYENADIGDMKTRLDDDTGQIAEFAEKQSFGYIISVVSLFAGSALLFIIEWRLAVFAMLAIPFTFWLEHVFSKKQQNIMEVIRVNDQNMKSWMHASISGWREVKALNIEASQKRKYMYFQHNQARGYAKWINYIGMRWNITPQIRDFLMQFGIFFIGGLFLIGGEITISSLLVFALYFGILTDAFRTVSSADGDLQSNMPFTDRLIEELNREETDDKQGVMPDDSNEIIFENVSFSYPKTQKNILHNFSITINKGERVAITGESGCGKTTLLKLMTGMLVPSGGTVFFSGVDLREIDLASMHRRIGFVMQENMLYNATIRENLMYGREDISDEVLLDACRKAYLDGFIAELKDGLNTVVGEKGIKLSGGQKQRLVLARMFLREVDIFIFDEATNALDQHSESFVQDAINSISGDKTIIVVAHRESSVRFCERKIVL